MKNDVIIIGGGAAGLFSAIVLKKRNPRLSIRLIERLPRVGKKLSTTGNGRCNITNKNISLDRYHGRNVRFAEYALNRYNAAFCEEIFGTLGVPFVFEGDKAFPASLQAASVVDCLRFAAEEQGVIVCTELKVTNIQISGGLYKVIADNLSFLAKNVIIATGLFSGGEKLGADGNMLSLLKKAGFKTVNTYPSIVQIKTETDVVRQLKGIKIDANVSLKEKGKTVRADFGEVLFCDYGLSGPPILQVSGGIADKEGLTASLDLMPHKNYNDIVEELKIRKENLKNRSADEFFTGMLNKRLGQVILKAVGIRLNTPVSVISIAEIKKIAEVFKDMRFKVLGTTGFSSSQVTSGGLDTDGFNPKTMESYAYRGLYAIGEILDIDGDCGGFNLQWAWSSALCAAEGILNAYNK